MAKQNPDSLAAMAQALSLPARLLLFCVASRTGWERAGITRATVTTTVVRGLIERDAAGGLTITKQGYATLAAGTGGRVTHGPPLPAALARRQ